MAISQILIPTLTADMLQTDSSYVADQVLVDLPPVSNGNYRFLLWELIFGRPGVADLPPKNDNFTDSYSES